MSAAIFTFLVHTDNHNHLQVEDVARLAAEEVARLKGQLADLDKKNKLQVRAVEAALLPAHRHMMGSRVGGGSAHPVLLSVAAAES